MDWEWAALPHEEDPSLTYPQEAEPGTDEEWLDEVSYVLAGPGATTPDPGAPTPDPGAATPDPGPATPKPVPTPKPEDFAEGGAADALAPGPALATLVDLMQRDGLGKLDDDQLTGVLQAANRLAAWSASVRVSAVSGLAARREAAGQATGDWRPFDHADDEIAVALTLTRRSAGRLLDFALGLDRLPLTRAALAAGAIDERRAEVIAEEVSGLDDEHAAAVEKLVIGRAPKLTSGQLRALVRRAVLAADPQAARRRKEKALRDARVEAFPETSGTAALAGRDLPPAAVLAADRHLTALAQAMKAAGIHGTLDILRARAYLHLLSGQPVSTLICAQQAATRDGGGPGAAAPGGPEAGLDFPAASGPGASHAGSGLTPGLRGSVNLTMPLSAWLGWTLPAGTTTTPSKPPAGPSPALPPAPSPGPPPETARTPPPPPNTGNKAYSRTTGMRRTPGPSYRPTPRTAPGR